MSVAEFISYLDDLKQTEKTEYAKNAHKPFAAYLKVVKSNGTINELYLTLNTVYKRFSEKYATTTVRNYMRYLQASLNLEKVKVLLDKDVFKIAQSELQEILRECDKTVHVAKAEKSSISGDDEESPIEAVDALEALESDWDLNEIKPQVDQITPQSQSQTHLHTQENVNVDAKHQADIYKAQLDCMWRLLELVFKKNTA